MNSQPVVQSKGLSIRVFSAMLIGRSNHRHRKENPSGHPPPGPNLPKQSRTDHPTGAKNKDNRSMGVAFRSIHAGSNRLTAAHQSVISLGLPIPLVDHSEELIRGVQPVKQGPPRSPHCKTQVNEE